MMESLIKNRYKKILLIAIVFMSIHIICPDKVIKMMTVSASEDRIEVKEIDLGEYSSQMTVGEKQLLIVTLLPQNAGEQSITYQSGNPKVADINGMGRITALSEGTSKIIVSCGNVKENFLLNVVAAPDTNVRDIDVGDCPNEIEVGTSQMLSVTIIPEDAICEKISYESANPEIASVNEIGRLSGIAKGETTITVMCGSVKKYFNIKVIEPGSEIVPVTDIEIGDYEDELEVDKTLTLYTTVLPADATNNKVSFESSDENIATVKSSGEVKGISEGDVVITISAGNIKKSVPLKVKIATSAIRLNSTYIVMQQGENYALKSTVYPAGADRNVLYESLNPDIITVSNDGVVTARNCGTATVIVKNNDTSTAATVIVNKEELGEQPIGKDNVPEKNLTEYTNTVSVEDYPVISADMLRYFYDTGQVLLIHGTDYTIQIDGKKICNYENEFYTDIQVRKTSDGMYFELNRSENLCGQVVIQFNDNGVKGKKLYLYNEAKKKYELLNTADQNSLKLDVAGKYLLTEKNISAGKIKLIVIIAVSIMLLVIIGVYIGVKKQYWFW